METQLKSTLKKFDIELEEEVFGHIIEASKYCSSKAELQDLCEGYLEDAGFSNIELFMNSITMENEMPEDVSKLPFEALELDSPPKASSMANQQPKSPKTSRHKRQPKQGVQENEFDDKPIQESRLDFSDISKHQAPGKRIKEIRKRKKNSNVEAAKVEEGIIEGYTQQSRFHVDTLDTLSNDIELNGVNITIGGKLPILVDAELKLYSGVKYALVGRNGVGKSSLFKALGHQILVGFPKNVRVFYVEQIIGSEDSRVMDVVMESDKACLRALREFDTLNAAMEKGDQKDLAQRIREIKLKRMEDEMYEQNQLAIKRSGARGNVARADLIISELEVGEARANLHTAHSKVELESSTSIAMQMVQDLHHFLEVFDAAKQEAKATKILKGLGFNDKQMHENMGVLSGGWKIRVSLAQALFMEPDILLLDEPTNHLVNVVNKGFEAYIMAPRISHLFAIHNSSIDFS